MKYQIKTIDGRITDFCDGDGVNVADKCGKFGTVCFTLKSDNIKTQEHEPFESYADRTSAYDEIAKISSRKTLCRDSKNRIETLYEITDDGLVIESHTDNCEISQFGINLDLNFLGKKGSDFKNQLMPTSPYTSADGKYMYFIFTRPNGKFAVATALMRCDGWRIKYSPFAVGHFIFNLQFLASFDRVYGGSEKKDIKIKISFADTLDAAYDVVEKTYGVPVLRNVLSGGFDNYASVELCGNADKMEIVSPSGKVCKKEYSEKIKLDEYGFYTVTPISNEIRGLNTVVWNGCNFTQLFDRCCDSVEKPYHPDDNLCEGGCFLWAMLLNMRFGNHRKYDSVAREQLDIIMAKSDVCIPRRTILPYPSDGFAAYHIFKSNRVQEQFFGVSILLEAYRLYGEKEILEYAVSALSELVDNYMKDGMVDIGTDYTTVCCPMIPLADMAVFLKNRGDKRYIRFEKSASQMAEFLFKRGYNFPTEGDISPLTDIEREDGSISCTALALLYYCTHIENKACYAEFAHEILKLHRAWTIYTPDARMYGSSFRWWETLWEGDGEGPAICAGHAWTIWKAEALFYDGVLFGSDAALLSSWNGFVTNFAKALPNGKMYSCYEPDYIRGGGDKGIKRSLKQLAGENIETKYTVAHSYPKHFDNSLSRYAWVRAGETWLKTAAVLNLNGKTIPINANLGEDGKWHPADFAKQMYYNGSVTRLDR